MTDRTPTAAPAAAAPVTAPEAMTVTCADGQRLQAHWFGARGEVHPHPVLISPATGVRQQFYWRFADWLASQGHHVMVFDYRGIGLSLDRPLAGHPAQLVEWGQQDQVAAIQAVLQRSGATQLVLVGHSAGAQMIGLLPNHHRVARLVGMAASTGWFGGMRTAFALKAKLGLGVLVPLATVFKGYAPTSLFGLGENLPAAVGRQWGQWCAAGGYATNAVRHHGAADFHADVTTPITVFHATDDDIATSATVQDLLRTLPAAPHTVHTVHPADHGLRHIGHLDWFRQSHRGLWPMVLAAVRGQASQTAA